MSYSTIEFPGWVDFFYVESLNLGIIYSIEPGGANQKAEVSINKNIFLAPPLLQYRPLGR